MRPGDIILQPLNCWLCSLIELEEGSIYSHMGVVLSVTPEVMIGEANGTVKKIKLSEFLSKTEASQRSLLIRFRNEKISEAITSTPQKFLETFEKEFEGAQYDNDFLWHNFDENDKEKLYCSEMVAKLFQYYLGIDMPIKLMLYQNYREHWLTYFQGRIPVNQWGNSPADFEKSDLFYKVGEL